MSTMRFQGPAGQDDMPYLLTPGPLTTSRTVKLALLADWGSRDVEFRRLVKEIRQELLRLAGCDDTYECVLMQGSGTFADRKSTRLNSSHPQHSFPTRRSSDLNSADWSKKFGRSFCVWQAAMTLMNAC